jgi:hypothetical protein
MNLTQMHNEKLIQAHQWRAAQWLPIAVINTSLAKNIQDACANIDTRLNSYSKKSNIDPYDVMMKVCVDRKQIPVDEITIGVLRESLNAVFRIMKRVEAN